MAEEGEIYRWHRYVPGACSDEDLHELRTLLAGYTEAEIRQRLNIPNPEVHSISFSEEPAATPIRTPLDVLIRLFHEGFYASEAELSADTLRLLFRLDILARDTRFPGLVYSTVAILPVGRELIVCDRGSAPDGSEHPLLPDLVYPPIYDNTLRYLGSLPSTPCDAMLEIGTGAGIGAIMGARHARRVWATDIAARAVHFASLNCRLAGLDNVTVLEGDLFKPVEGLTFDRIAFHPPWVPASPSTLVFGDGGQDGEAIIRGSIEGLPRFLRPGGRFYAIVLGSDREGEKFEQRVRRWLGAAEDRFDVALAELARESPDGFLSQNLARGSIAEREIPLWIELWKATRTEAMVYGHLIVERHEGEREAVTSRAPFQPGAGANMEPK
jgi:SAM-dependent methyltransferase